MYSTLPTIDFSRFLDGSPEDRREIVSEIDGSLKTVGAFYLRNYGIDRAKTDAWFDWVSWILLIIFQLLTRKSKSRRFFSLPLSEKEMLVPTARSFERGYFGLGKEKVRGRASMKENFDFGNPADNDLSCWPPEELLPGFRHFAADFHQVRAHF
jgi:isopenicillin N synthase-like dioxygenase